WGIAHPLKHPRIFRLDQNILTGDSTSVITPIYHLETHPAMSYSREDYYRTITCVDCGYNCKFACLDAHKSSFACHNPGCANHLGTVEVDLPGGTLYSRERSRKSSSRHESSSHRRSRSSTRNPEEPSSRRSRSRTTHHYEYTAPPEEPSSRRRSGSTARYPEEPSSHHRSRSSARRPEESRRSSGYAPQGHPSSYQYRHDAHADYVTVEPDDTEDMRQRFERMGREERSRYPPSSSSGYRYPPSSSHYGYPPSSSHSGYPPSGSQHRSRSSSRQYEEPRHHRSYSYRGPAHEEIEILDAGSSPYVAPSSKRGRPYPPRSGTGRRYAYGPYDEPPRTPDLPPAPYVYIGTWDPEGNQID
ncbi:hypothetical protein QBC41DRAFT_378936, partial [Cercophora samala]